MIQAAIEPGVLEEQYERTVREDIERFRGEANAWMAGTLSDDRFRAARLRRGVYGQRQAGVHMVRTKVPGGMLTAAQVRQLARAADEYGQGRGHITTRQNMQFHFVPLPRVAGLLHLLADARLTTREACYNTVRNVTACPLSGLLKDEVFDVRPYARRTAFAFLHNPLTDSLPRKFKIAFSGCKDDCVEAAINDVGLRALIRDGRRGFRMSIGGGLGPLPNEARLLHDFVPEEELIGRIEAVIRVFDRHGNRENKNKARLKFVLRERGFEWLRDAIEKEYEGILRDGGIAAPVEAPEGFGGFESAPPPLANGASLPVVRDHSADAEFDRWRETNVVEQKEPGYAAAFVSVPQGNLTAAQMRTLARLSESAGDSRVRFTVSQNAVLAYLPAHSLQRVYSALKVADLARPGAGEISDIVTCPGAWTCNLGLTKTMNLGEALARTVSGYTDPSVKRLSIKASGCPNACGQHWTGDVGFYGNARKVDGREIPYYQMLLGGGYDREGNMRFGLAISSVAARLAPLAVQRVLDHYVAHRAPGEAFRDYVLRHRVEFFRGMLADLAKPPEIAPELYKDWGDEEDFSLQLGRGECAS